jgi:hypothetical protein
MMHHARVTLTSAFRSTKPSVFATLADASVNRRLLLNATTISRTLFNRPVVFSVPTGGFDTQVTSTQFGVDLSWKSTNATGGRLGVMDLDRCLMKNASTRAIGLGIATD